MGIGREQERTRARERMGGWVKATARDNRRIVHGKYDEKRGREGGHAYIPQTHKDINRSRKLGHANLNLIHGVCIQIFTILLAH